MVHPAARGTGTWSDSAHSASCSVTRLESANSNGSVMGVLCRYKTFGFAANRAAASPAPQADPVTRTTSAETQATVMANETIEIRIADAPVW